jgi:hypothetical protein
MSSKIHVQLEGSGYNIWLLFITPGIYERLRINAGNDFPESAFDILEEEDLMADARLAAHGIDSYSDFTGKIVSGSEELPITGVINTYKDYSLADVVADEELKNIETLIECNLKNAERFGDGESLNLDSLIIIDITEISHCTLDAWLDGDGKKLDIRNFQLLTMDLDSNNDYSKATYSLGVLKGVERDIRGISYKGKEAEFELAITKGYRELMLVRYRDGDWEIDSDATGWLSQ